MKDSYFIKNNLHYFKYEIGHQEEEKISFPFQNKNVAMKNSFIFQ